MSIDFKVFSLFQPALAQIATYVGGKKPDFTIKMNRRDIINWLILHKQASLQKGNIHLCTAHDSFNTSCAGHNPCTLNHF